VSEEARDRRNARLREKIVCPTCGKTCSRSTRYKHKCKGQAPKRTQCPNCLRWLHPAALGRHWCIDPVTGKQVILGGLKICHNCRLFRGAKASFHWNHGRCCSFTSGSKQRGRHVKGVKEESKGTKVGMSKAQARTTVGFCCGTFQLHIANHRCARDKKAPTDSARAKSLVVTGSKVVGTRATVFSVGEDGEVYNRVEYVSEMGFRTAVQHGVSSHSFQ
jgi:hypothetical protein